jgi:hypothetical protein
LSLLGYAFLALTDMGPDCEGRLFDTDLNLRYARHCIRVFKKDMGRFPESLQELYEYGKEKIRKGETESSFWRFPFEESISRHWRTEGSHEHAVLDGSGGYFYNPENGDIRVNLTRPLRHCWRGYSGRKSDEIPADW